MWKMKVWPNTCFLVVSLCHRTTTPSQWLHCPKNVKNNPQFKRFRRSLCLNFLPLWLNKPHVQPGRHTHTHRYHMMDSCVLTLPSLIIRCFERIDFWVTHWNAALRSVLITINSPRSSTSILMTWSIYYAPCWPHRNTAREKTWQIWQEPRCCGMTPLMTRGSTDGGPGSSQLPEYSSII